MIITGGVNVYPAEIENILDDHVNIAEVAVFGIPDEEWGEAVCAVVVPKEEFMVGDVIDFDSSTLFMDGTDNRVGIRNTNPQYELDVTGTINATNFRGNISVGTIDDWITHTGDTNTKFGLPAADAFAVCIVRFRAALCNSGFAIRTPPFNTLKLKNGNGKRKTDQ